MASVQVSRASRMWAFGAAATLAGTTALVSVPDPATAAEALSAPAEGTVIAPTSPVRLTGDVGLTDDAVYGETAAGVVTIPRDGSAADWSPVTVDGARLTGRLLGAEGDALLVAAADGTDTLAWRADDGVWASRTVAAGTRLGHGGVYAVLPTRPASRGAIETDVVDARSGTVTFTHRTYGSTDPVAVTGSTLWRSSVFHDDKTTAWDVVSGAYVSDDPDGEAAWTSRPPSPPSAVGAS